LKGVVTSSSQVAQEHCVHTSSPELSSAPDTLCGGLPTL
jgi:hypothetical protein